MGDLSKAKASHSQKQGVFGEKGNCAQRSSSSLAKFAEDHDDDGRLLFDLVVSISPEPCFQDQVLKWESKIR